MLKTVITVISRLMSVLGGIAATLLIFLVFMMAYNVLMRYAFNDSSIGLEELSWHFYAAIFLLGIPYALKSGSHVRVDLLFEKFSRRTQLVIDLIGTMLFLIPTCLIIVWAGWNFTMAAYQLGGQPASVAEFFNQLVGSGIGEKSQDPGGLLNRWIIKGVIPLSFAFLLLGAIGFLLEKIVALRDHNSEISS